MDARSFSTIEEAADYLSSSNFAYPTQIQKYDGKNVLVLFMLSPEGTKLYRSISRDGSRAITSEVVKSGLQAYARPAASLISEAHKGSLFGMVKSLFSVGKAMDTFNADNSIDDRISARSTNASAYMKFQDAFVKRQNEGYVHIKKNIYPAQRGPIRRLEGEADGKYLCMLRLS